MFATIKNTLLLLVALANIITGLWRQQIKFKPEHQPAACWTSDSYLTVSQLYYQQSDRCLFFFLKQDLFFHSCSLAILNKLPGNINDANSNPMMQFSKAQM